MRIGVGTQRSESKNEIRLVLFIVYVWGRHITHACDCCAFDFLLTSRLSRISEYCCVASRLTWSC